MPSFTAIPQPFSVVVALMDLDIKNCHIPDHYDEISRLLGHAIVTSNYKDGKFSFLHTRPVQSRAPSKAPSETQTQASTQRPPLATPKHLVKCSSCQDLFEGSKSMAKQSDQTGVKEPEADGEGCSDCARVRFRASISQALNSAIALRKKFPKIADLQDSLIMLCLKKLIESPGARLDEKLAFINCRRWIYTQHASGGKALPGPEHTLKEVVRRAHVPLSDLAWKIFLDKEARMYVEDASESRIKALRKRRRKGQPTRECTRFSRWYFSLLDDMRVEIKDREEALKDPREKVAPSLPNPIAQIVAPGHTVRETWIFKNDGSAKLAYGGEHGIPPEMPPAASARDVQRQITPMIGFCWRVGEILAVMKWEGVFENPDPSCDLRISTHTSKSTKQNNRVSHLERTMGQEELKIDSHRDAFYGINLGTMNPSAPSLAHRQVTQEFQILHSSIVGRGRCQWFQQNIFPLRPAIRRLQQSSPSKLTVL
ncbi:hypothetical protein G7Y89_g8582 [Cudoniella acicularis]|uniref:Uncharacterized protein n=1 Tax=Cudoniella acicularis TaxID=354080 RepID=A0A8H4RIF5_9HELO|nr:hypothetical protein G7Y89_g8582 [Cudoniella acicularis]